MRRNTTIAIVVLLLLNLIKAPTYLAIRTNPVTGNLAGHLLDILRELGVALRQLPQGADIVLQRIGHIVHALAAIAIMLVVIVHIYAAFYVRGTISAMTEGKVTGGWAFRHHRRWLREEARKGVVDERQKPPPGRPRDWHPAE